MMRLHLLTALAVHSLGTQVPAERNPGRRRRPVTSNCEKVRAPPLDLQQGSIRVVGPDEALFPDISALRS